MKNIKKSNKMSSLAILAMILLFSAVPASAGMQSSYESSQDQFTPAMNVNNAQPPINFSTYNNVKDASSALLKKFDTGGGHINYSGLSKALWDGKFDGAKFSKQELITVLVEDLKAIRK